LPIQYSRSYTARCARIATGGKGMIYLLGGVI
jgi:hypothetical protein